MEELEATISGRVQMVMFRDFAQRKARKLGLLGFVRNNENGSVTVVAQGNRVSLESFITYLKKGSFLSRVDSVSVTWRLPQQTFDDFIISY